MITALSALLAEIVLNVTVLERPGLLRPRPLFGSTHESGDVRDPNTDRRPADVYLPRWKRGTPAALDLAVTSGLRRDLIESSALDGSSAVSIYKDFKRTHLNTETACLEEGIQFIPLICEEDGVQQVMQYGRSSLSTSHY